MTSQWLTWLNCAILGAIACLLLGLAWIWFLQPSEILCTNPVDKQCSLPKRAFTMAPENYKKLGAPLLTLQNAAPTLQLPDLRQHLIYYGKNGRPDAQSAHTHIHFSFLGNKNVVSIPPNEKLYLLYDKKITPCHYIFSPHNRETSLWIEAQPLENEVLVKLFMKNEKGELIKEPDTHAQFKLSEKEFIRYAGAAWEINNTRVDGTLLARQRARWFGADKFLEQHGGEEYKDAIDKQRIDFGENDDIYSIFASTNDCFTWDGSKWKSIKPGEESLKHPLLVVKKIDERLMTFELWDVEGKGKVMLNILKSSEPWLVNQNSLQQMFKFVGARTRSQCVFEINHERMLLSPSDWIILTNKGWVKLGTEKEVDEYVKRKTIGTMFVFEGVSRKEDRQVILGKLYNPTRSEFQNIELSIHPVGNSKMQTGKDFKEKEEDEEDEEESSSDNSLRPAMKLENGEHKPHPPVGFTAPHAPQAMTTQPHNPK